MSRKWVWGINPLPYTESPSTSPQGNAGPSQVSLVQALGKP